MQQLKHNGDTLTLWRKSTDSGANTGSTANTHATGQDNPNPAPLGATGSPHTRPAAVGILGSYTGATHTHGGAQAAHAGWREAVGSMGR